MRSDSKPTTSSSSSATVGERAARTTAGLTRSHRRHERRERRDPPALPSRESFDRVEDDLGAPCRSGHVWLDSVEVDLFFTPSRVDAASVLDSWCTEFRMAALVAVSAVCF